MFLTRFRINPARRGSRKLLASPQAMHAAVLAGFPRPEDHTSSAGRTLWRVDHEPAAQVLLYIVSPSLPDLTHLVEQAGWPTADATWESRPYTAFLEGLSEGQRWAFRLTANPTRNRRPKDGSATTQRFGEVTIASQVNWLASRAAAHGFSVAKQHDGQLNVLVHQRKRHVFKRRPEDRPVTIATVTFDGVLRVEDVARFRGILTAGIGHARAYGCGLMTLAPAEVKG